jgi:hypothetical protein
MFGLSTAFVFAAVFYGAAEYERMNGWKWAIASFVLSVVVIWLTGWRLMILPAQFGLFIVLWWQNSKRLDHQGEDRAAAQEADRRRRQDEVRRAQADADRKQQGRQ